MQNCFVYVDCLKKVLLIAYGLLKRSRFQKNDNWFRITKEASILAFYSILKTTCIKRNNESDVKSMYTKNQEKSECSIPIHKRRDFSIKDELPYWARATEHVSPSSSNSCHSEYCAGLTSLICVMTCLLTRN